MNGMEQWLGEKRARRGFCRRLLKMTGGRDGEGRDSRQELLGEDREAPERVLTVEIRKS